MTTHRDGNWGYARCDRCGLTTPKIAAPNETALAEVLRAAGWFLLERSVVHCPSCGPLSAVEYIRKYMPNSSF